jgi:PIN domain nuclease of toxin-antitoxin system
MPPSSPRPLVLDTHVWIWIMEGLESALSPSTVRLLEEGAVQGQLVVSAISVWEVAMLEARGRMTLSVPLDEWIRSALTAPGLRVVDVTPEIALESTRLPVTHHGAHHGAHEGAPYGDPADRILMATARVLGGTLVTCDEGILRYAADGHVRTRGGRDFT